jgi:hypothetical protein
MYNIFPYKVKADTLSQMIKKYKFTLSEATKQEGEMRNIRIMRK